MHQSVGNTPSQQTQGAMRRICLVPRSRALSDDYIDKTVNAAALSCASGMLAAIALSGSPSGLTPLDGKIWAFISLTSGLQACCGIVAMCQRNSRGPVERSVELPSMAEAEITAGHLV